MPASELARMDVKAQRRILIVDNEESIQAALTWLLKSAGYETLATWSGIAALELLQLSKFDVLLVNDYLADLHVDEFLKRVSLLPIPPRVVVMQAGTAKTIKRDFCQYTQLPSCSTADKTHMERVIQAIGAALEK